MRETTKAYKKHKFKTKEEWEKRIHRETRLKNRVSYEKIKVNVG